jgi:hypothetical protein
MTEIRTDTFLVFGGVLYPASGRPQGCHLQVFDAELESVKLTPRVLLESGLNFCVGRCQRCSIILA